MIVDVHGHLVPPELLAAIRAEKGRLPSLRLIEEQGGLALQFGSARPTRPAMKGLSDVPGRIAWMDKQGIDRHVVGGWPDWLGNDLPPAEGEIWCKLTNDALLAAAKAQPRFIPLAAVPMQDGARAASVLKSAMAAGFPGVMISTLPRGIGSVLDAPDLDPFWKAADETGAVVHIHPAFDAGESRVNDYGLANGVGPDQRRAGGLLAAGHERPHHPLPECEVLCAHRRRRAALRGGPAEKEPQHHARYVRSGRGAQPDLHRHHRARPKGAAICH